MRKIKLYSDMKNIDLNVHEYGYEDCKPCHSYGPAVREYYLFHYIFSGKGCFRTGERTYFLHEGQGFLIFPGDLNYYEADTVAPWSYGWLGVTGINAAKYIQQCGLSKDNPIWDGGKDTFIEECILKLSSSRSVEPVRQPEVTGYAYLILSRMIKRNSFNQSYLKKINRQESYLHAAVEYMQHNYYRNIKIEDVAKYVGLDRSYLGSIFKKYLKTSMQSFLIDLRINKACRLLANENLRVADIARSVGYSDQLQFSKIFKARKGLSPLDYRKKR